MTVVVNHPNGLVSLDWKDVREFEPDTETSYGRDITYHIPTITVHPGWWVTSIETAYDYTDYYGVTSRRSGDVTLERREGRVYNYKRTEYCADGRIGTRYGNHSMLYALVEVRINLAYVNGTKRIIADGGRLIVGGSPVQIVYDA